MSIWLVDAAAEPVMVLLGKASALLAATALVHLLLWNRRASAAGRHFLWTGALAALLLLPVVDQLVPPWSLPLPVRPSATEGTAFLPAVESHLEQSTRVVSSTNTADVPAAAVTAGRTVTATTIALAVYAFGVVVLLLSWSVHRWRVWRFIRESTAVDGPEWAQLFSECKGAMGVSRPVRLLSTRERNVPLAFGTRHPAIVIPAIAETWDEDRRRAVLLHELAHVARFDCLTHSIALGACAMYWFHPAIWWVAKRVRIEREFACDDRVIAAGAEPKEYASHLLEIAYSLGGRRAPALAVCMARPRQLEGRMLAALDAARNRRAPSRRAQLGGSLAVMVVLAALGAARPVVTTAEAPPAASERQWPGAADTSERIDAAITAMTTEMKGQTKAIAHLPLDAMKETRGAVRAVASAIGVPQDNVPGTWEIRPTDTTGTVHLRIVELNSSTGTDVRVAQLEGLTGVQLSGAGGSVQFKVRRDAGTFTFEGVIRNGVGAGTFTFAADPSFPDQLAKRGFARPTAGEQYQMARHDIGFAFVDELTKQGYGKPQTSELVRAGQHGIQTDYLRDMAALGYRVGTLDVLITLRDHGVTPAYVRGLADSGYKNLPADDLREARDHGVTPEYVRAMRDSGYGSLQMGELIKVRDHGITPEFVHALGDAGYRQVPLDQLVRVRDHGVTAEYINGMQQLGYSLSLDDLVKARDHGVTVEYVRDLSALGYGKQPIDGLIRLRDHGVTSEYAKEVKSLGYDKLTVDDLITLRDHGLTVERIRSANSRAGTQLPIDMLKALAAGGMR
jgi:beta-lactamase regulating signal transducer with metallopeptidase domain